MISYAATTTTPGDEAFEPDDKWKAALKYRINKEAEGMFAEARKTFDDKISQAAIHAGARDSVRDEYMKVMANLEEVASEQYEIELQTERDHRRQVYLTTISTLPKRAPEPAIERVRDLSPSSDDEPQVERNTVRRPSKPSSDSSANLQREGVQAAAGRRVPATSSDLSESSSLRPKRRPSDAEKRQDRQEEPRSASHRTRPRLSGVFDEQSEESRPTRSRQPTGELPTSGTPTDRPWDSSLGKSAGGSIRSGSERHNARSPPNTEFRRGSAPPPDDLVPPTKPFSQVNRRGSTASMRSTGSGASIRPMTETIPERIDDLSDDDHHRGDRQGHDRSPRKASGKARERRRDSRPTPVDPILRHEESMSSIASSRMSGPSSATMQYATSSFHDRPLSSISASASLDDRYFAGKPPDSDERRHLADRPSKPGPYVDPHISGGYSHREGFSPREPPPSASRPPPSRSPYQPDDRDYNPPPPRPLPPRSPYNADEYSPRDTGHRHGLPRSPYDDRDFPPPRDMHAHAPHGPPPSRQYSIDERDYSGSYPSANGRHIGPPKSPAFMNDREYSSSPQSAYSYDDPRRREHGQWDRQPAWNDERDLREYGRDREREPYADPRGPVHPQYSRAPVYPMASPDQSRGPHDFHANGYDDRGGYPRTDNTRPNIPSRQPSYTRRATPDRRAENEPESYPPRQYYSPMENNYSPPEPPATPAWKEWKSDTRPPPPHMQRVTEPSSYPRSPAPPNGQQYATSYPHRSRSHRYRRDPASPSDVDSPVLDDTDPEDPSGSEEDEESHDTSYSRSQSGTDEGDDADEEADDSEAHARRKMHENTRQIKEQKRELDALAQAENDAARMAREKEKNLQRVEDSVRKKQQAQRREEESRRKDEERKAEAARKKKEQETREREEELRLKADEEARRRAEEARIKEEELKQKEAEARRIEQEAKEKAEEAQRKEEEARLLKERLAKEEALARQKQEQAERTAAMLKKKELEAKKKESEVSKREKDALKQKEEAQRLQQDALRKADEAKRKEKEVRRKEKEAREKEEALKREAEEMRKLAQMAQQEQEKAQQEQEKLRALIASAEERERLLAIREAEVKEREESAQRLAAEAREAEARRLEEEEGLKREQEEEEAKRQAEEAEQARKAEEDEARRQQEVKDAETKRREAELINKAKERARQKHDEEVKRKEEIARQEAQAAAEAQAEARRASEVKANDDLDEFINLDDPKLIKEQAFLFQQAKYAQRADDIRRRAQGEQRARNDSIGNGNLSSSPGQTSSMPRPAPPSSSQPTPQYRYNQPPTSYPTPPTVPPAFDFNQSSSSGNYSPSSDRERSSGTSGVWSSSMKSPPPTTSARPSAGIPFQSKPSPSPSSSYPSGASPSTQSPLSEEDRARKQAEFVRQQQEWFRRDQEQKEADVQMRRAGAPLTREEMVKLFERHDRQWKRAAEASELTWNDFPWPMARAPNNPDEITYALVNAYMQSPHWPDKEKAKKTKDRIKDQMKKWHPDRFETKYLPRVQDRWKETVKQGAGNVTRHLGDLLRKENEGNLFGD